MSKNDVNSVKDSNESNDKVIANDVEVIKIEDPVYKGKPLLIKLQKKTRGRAGWSQKRKEVHLAAEEWNEKKLSQQTSSLSTSAIFDANAKSIKIRKKKQPATRRKIKFGSAIDDNHDKEIVDFDAIEEAQIKIQRYKEEFPDELNGIDMKHACSNKTTIEECEHTLKLIRARLSSVNSKMIKGMYCVGVGAIEKIM